MAEMTELREWANFYMIVGSSAGALIGLQFVVMTLIANLPRHDMEAGTAFTTPTVVHFGAVLLISGLISAPWHGITTVTLLWGLAGLSGIGYTLIVARRQRRQTTYQPVFEDWLFHVFLPIFAYAILPVAAFAAHFHLRAGLFLVGATALLLLFTGIHNAWDIVTYHVFGNNQK